MKTKNNTDFMTTGEVARRLNRSASMVLKYERQARLLAFRTDRGMRIFLRDNVEKLFLELQRKDAKNGK